MPINNIKDGGSEYMLLKIQNVISKNGIDYDVNHQIIIKDVSTLERTTLCEQLGLFPQ